MIFIGLAFQCLSRLLILIKLILQQRPSIGGREIVDSRNRREHAAIFGKGGEYNLARRAGKKESAVLSGVVVIGTPSRRRFRSVQIAIYQQI